MRNAPSRLNAAGRHVLTGQRSSHVEPQWHFWLSYGTDTVPNQDPIMVTNRTWASKHHIPNPTMGPGAFKTYST